MFDTIASVYEVCRWIIWGLIVVNSIMSLWEK